MAKFKQPLDEKTVALTLGLLFGLLEIVWIVLAQAGGQPFLAWILGLHGVSIQVSLLPFNPLTAVADIVVHFVQGLIIGGLFAVIWNWVVKR